MSSVPAIDLLFSDQNTGVLKRSGDVLDIDFALTQSSFSHDGVYEIPIADSFATVVGVAVDLPVVLERVERGQLSSQPDMTAIFCRSLHSRTRSQSMPKHGRSWCR